MTQSKKKKKNVLGLNKKKKRYSFKSMNSELLSHILFEAVPHTVKTQGFVWKCNGSIIALWSIVWLYAQLTHGNTHWWGSGSPSKLLQLYSNSSFWLFKEFTLTWSTLLKSNNELMLLVTGRTMKAVNSVFVPQSTLPTWWALQHLWVECHCRGGGITTPMLIF